MANSFSYLVLLGWPLIGWLMVRKQKFADTAVILLILVPYLLLPVAISIDPPVIPPLDKVSIPSITVLAILFFKYRKFSFLPKQGAERYLVILLLIFPLFTVLTNMDSYRVANRYLEGLSLFDILSMLFDSLTLVLIPLMAGYLYLNTAESHRRMLVVLVISGFLYSVPILWEVRMSPQLHGDLYGFFPHDWRQQMRQGGFRPVVFLGHGLKVAVFFSLTLIAALILWRQREGPLRHKAFIKLGFMAVVLLLCKTWGAAIYAVAAFFVVAFLGTRGWIRAAMLIAALVILFPLLRGADLIPTQKITGLFANYNEERAGSLAFRFRNEDLLLEKANQKPLFGWGGWGRSRVFDPNSGEDISVTDGEWIIRYGSHGWVGYLVPFGLLCLPIWKLSARARRERNNEISPFSAGLALVLAFGMLDQLPNSSINPLMFLIAGAILGSLAEVRGRAPLRAAVAV